MPETFPQAAASDFALILKAVLPPTRAAIVAEKTESIPWVSSLSFSKARPGAASRQSYQNKSWCLF